MTRLLVTLGLVTLAVGSGCVEESGDDDGPAEASASDTGPNGSSESSTGDESASGTGDESASGTDEGLTDGMESFFVDGCGFESACTAWSNNCDYDGCASKEVSPSSDCVFQALSSTWSGTRVFIEVHEAAEGASTRLVGLGDGTAVWENHNGFRECQLQPAEWFDDCVGNATLDNCYNPLAWRTGECTDVAPYCPEL